MENEIQTIEQQQPLTTLQMVSDAMQRGMEMEHIEKFMELHRQHEADEAKKAYHKAFAEFKADPPQIFKDMAVSYGNTSYNHASIGNVVSSIITGLGKHELSHSWDVAQDGNSITIKCTITHSLGHSESTSMTAPPDDSGKKNSIQAIASTTTYLQRYTLLAITGLATSEMDNDGQSYGKKEEPSSNGINKWLDWLELLSKGESMTESQFDEIVAGQNEIIESFKGNEQKRFDNQLSECREYLRGKVKKNHKPETVTCPAGGIEIAVSDCKECETVKTCEIHK